MKGEKLVIIPFICGLAIIFGLEFLNPGEGKVVVNPDFPALSAGLFVKNDNYWCRIRSNYDYARC